MNINDIRRYSYYFAKKYINVKSIAYEDAVEEGIYRGLLALKNHPKHNQILIKKHISGGILNFIRKNLTEKNPLHKAITESNNIYKEENDFDNLFEYKDNIEESAEKNNFIDIVEKFIENSPKKEIFEIIYKERYINNMSLKQISQKYKMSLSYIQSSEYLFLSSLRKIFNSV